VAHIAIINYNGIRDKGWQKYCVETCREAVERIKSRISSLEASSTLLLYKRNYKNIELDEMDRDLDGELFSNLYTT
jgi:two-component sensor histidine kinase